MSPTAQAPPPPAVSAGTLWVRGVVFAVVAAFLVGAPLLRQAAGVRNPYLPQWVMFVGYGLDVCAVRYSQLGEDGALHELDRFDVLGHPTWVEAPTSVKRVSDLQAGERLGRQLCKALGPGADVRMSLRCAARTGWTVQAEDERNLCRSPAKPPPKTAQGMP